MPGETQTALDPQTIQELRRLQEEYGNPEFVNQLVGLFLDNAPRRLAQIREATTKGDATTLEHVAHTLKSNCAMIGATRLSSMCAALERHGEQGAIAEARAVLDDAADELARVQRELKAITS